MWKPEFGTLYDQSAVDIDGNQFDFNSLKGKVCLVVNVACDCGYTKSGYTSMVEMHQKYKDRGFEVLAFPSNQFGKQESRPENEIKEYVSAKYGVEFPLFSKVEVNGENTHPLYQWLKQSLPGDVTWNFAAKFIIDHRGIPVERLESEPWSMVSNKIDRYLTDAAAEKASEGGVAAGAAGASTEAAAPVAPSAPVASEQTSFFDDDDDDVKVPAAPAAADEKKE